MDIHHCFMARLLDRSKIDTIKSHIQPLGQCREWIKNNFPNAKIIAESSTAEAIRSTKDDNVGFIGSEEAGMEYNLNILDKNIEDKKNNSTEFYILSNHADKKLEKELRPKHTIMIITVLDRPGVLNDVLGAFASRKINLAKLHSRTSSVKAWDYYFFLEVECLPNSPKFKKALEEIKKYCSIIRILGIV
jgi:chorismate mutase/prephenate dehydratase